MAARYRLCAALTRTTSTVRFGPANAADGSNETKLVSRARPFRITTAKISPSGKSIVFAAGQSENQSNDFGLYEIDIETGKERLFTAEKFFNIKGHAWLPGSSDLLIAASRTPNRNFRLWQVSGVDGSATPLTKDSDDYSMLSLDKAGAIISTVQIRADYNLIIYNLENSSEKRAWQMRRQPDLLRMARYFFRHRCLITRKSGV